MTKSVVELLVGGLDEKRIYRRIMKRVNTLPKDYRFAFKKIQHYMYHFDSAGSDMNMFADLVDLFEASAAEGKPVLDVVGSDVCEFCDELIRASSIDTLTTREKFNKEILEWFHRRECSS